MKMNADFFGDVVKNESFRAAFRSVIANLAGTSKTHLVNLRIPPRGKDAAHQFSWRISRTGSVRSYFSPRAAIVLCKFSQSNVFREDGNEASIPRERDQIFSQISLPGISSRWRREETLDLAGSAKDFRRCEYRFFTRNISGNGIERVTGAAWRVSPRGTHGREEVRDSDGRGGLE